MPLEVSCAKWEGRVAFLGSISYTFQGIVIHFFGSCFLKVVHCHFVDSVFLQDDWCIIVGPPHFEHPSKGGCAASSGTYPNLDPLKKERGVQNQSIFEVEIVLGMSLCTEIIQKVVHVSSFFSSGWPPMIVLKNMLEYLGPPHSVSCFCTK